MENQPNLKIAEHRFKDTKSKNGNPKPTITMGKKKSKTSKQKQAKTGRKLSKAFTKKLGISEGKPEDMVIANSKAATETSGNKKGKNARRARNPMKDSKAMADAAQKKATPGNGATEKKDFESQQASMNERERHVTWKRNDIKKNNNSKNATASSTMSMSNQNPLQLLQPASFCATDAEKSTSQLVQETLHSVSGLSGIGATATSPFSNNTHMQQGQQPGQSSLAMAVANSTERWTAQADAPDKAQRQNPWAVLGTGDDDDDDAGAGIHFANQQQISQPSPFQFAPATFSFGDNNNATNTSNLAMDGEMDPDL
jgi:hypothetical protein